MSIEKKSLISTRAATKKAIVTKPEVTKVESAKLLKARVMPVHRLKAPSVRITAGTRIATVHVVPASKIKI